MVFSDIPGQLIERGSDIVGLPAFAYALVPSYNLMVWSSVILNLKKSHRGDDFEVWGIRTTRRRSCSTYRQLLISILDE